jgi:hypothetical protein
LSHQQKWYKLSQPKHCYIFNHRVWVDKIFFHVKILSIINIKCSIPDNPFKQIPKPTHLQNLLAPIISNKDSPFPTLCKLIMSNIHSHHTIWSFSQNKLKGILKNLKKVCKLKGILSIMNNIECKLVKWAEDIIYCIGIDWNKFCLLTPIMVCHVWIMSVCV